MKKTSRRLRRSNNTRTAASYLFEAAIAETKAKAIALTTVDGLLVVGAGEGIDVEWMGAVGAASKRRRFTWENHRLSVTPILIDGVPACITVAGGIACPARVTEGIKRIFTKRELTT